MQREGLGVKFPGATRQRISTLLRRGALCGRNGGVEKEAFPSRAKEAAEKGLIAEENSSGGIPQGLMPTDFIGFIGILRLRSGQARSRALSKRTNPVPRIEFFRSL